VTNGVVRAAPRVGSVLITAMCGTLRASVVISVR
jgi:hypothetical protein